MKFNKIENIKARRSLLAAAIGTAFAVTNISAFAEEVAQDETADKLIERISVTGSRIQRTDMETAIPVTTITKADIQATGLNDIAGVLAKSIFNTSGTTIAHANNSAGNHASSNLRGIGTNRTLTLLNGRRVAGSSTLSGVGLNLSLIPLEAVERIDILRSGASSIYGADAMGGVINIITKSDYEGMHVKVNGSRPTQGGLKKSGIALTAGMSDENNSLMLVLEQQNSGGLLSGSRDNIDHKLNSRRATTRYQPYGYYYTFDENGNRENFESAGPNCPQERITERANGTGCDFDYETNALYIPDTKRTSLFTRYSRSFSDNLEFYTQALYTKDISESRASWNWIWEDMAADNINNPTLSTGNPRDIKVHSATPYNRTSNWNSQLFDFNAGLNWDTDYGSLNVNLSHSRDKVTQANDGYLFSQNLTDAITDGSYNPFDPNPASQEVLDSIFHTEFREAESISKAIIVDWAATTSYELDGGQVGYAVGVEYRENEVDDHKDAQSASGNVRGPYGNEVSGEYSYKAIYGEIELPFTEDLTVTAATRYDSYSLPDASNVSSALSARYQLTDDLVFRASYNEGFRVAALEDVTGTNSIGYNRVIDPKYCNPVPKEERATSELCDSVQVKTQTNVNPDIEPEESKQYSAGLAFNVTEDVGITLDYYSIEVTNEITSVSLRAVLDEEVAGNLGNYSGLSVTRDLTAHRTNEITEVVRNATNYLGFDTSGVDFAIDAKFDLEGLGELKVNFETAYTLEYTNQTTTLSPVYDWTGLVSNPKYRSNLAFNYSYDKFTAYTTVRYIDGFDGETPQQQEDGVERNDFSSMTTVDIGIGYEFDDYGTATFRVINAFDRMPAVNDELYHGYSTSIHSIIGREMEVTWSKSF